MMFNPKPFSLSIPDLVLLDLKHRLSNTRWPDQIPEIGWQQGTEKTYLQALVHDWAHEFDWRKQEGTLNQLRHFQVELGGVLIHFVHIKAKQGGGLPLILLHGWPSTFLEMLPLVPFLEEFDLVIPSLLGYGFSERPLRTGVNYRYSARLFHQLMQGLGYEKYGAAGTDFGSGIATLMALDYPQHVEGLYLSTLDIAPYTGAGSRALSEAEQAYLADNQAWANGERGYSSIQSTKPQTLGYGLNDSPVGLAAWIVEKWRTWSDCKGEIEPRFSRDFLLSMLTIYWANQNITASMRDYYDNRWLGVNLDLEDRVSVPTAISVFDHAFAKEGTPPKEWAERLYSNIQQWTLMPRGGHFAAAEEPQLLTEEMRRFFELPSHKV